ncbi:MAG: hypothetical protein LOD90_06560 [Symbiobacteriaceae bacterium]
MARQMSPRLSVDWEGLAARTAALARGAGRLPSVTSVTVPAPPIDPVALFARAAPLTEFRMLWVAPRGEQSMVGLGAAAVIEAEGPAPLRQVEAAWAQLAGGAVAEGPPGAWGTGPVLLGGIAFDPAAGADPVWAGFPAARFVLPIFGAVELTRAMLFVIRAVHDGFSGREALQSRLLNIGVAVILIAIPLTGVWVPLSNALLSAIEWAIRPLEAAVESVR